MFFYKILIINARDNIGNRYSNRKRKSREKKRRKKRKKWFTGGHRSWWLLNALKWNGQSAKWTNSSPTQGNFHLVNRKIGLN